MTTSIITNEGIDGHALVRVGAEATQLDRRLAQALEELLASPHAACDPDESNRPILIEALAWTVLTALVWLAIALSL
jgi:hypothetical protein